MVFSNAFIWAPSYTKVYSAKSSFKWLAIKHEHHNFSPLSGLVSDTDTDTCVWVKFDVFDRYPRVYVRVNVGVS